MAGLRFYRAVGDVISGMRRHLAFRQSPNAARNFKVSGDRNNSFAASLAPKPKFLYFVEFVSPFTSGDTPTGADPSKYSNTSDGSNSISFQVKEIARPNVTVKSKTLNQYNKKRVIQTAIEYDPLTITFHDDIANNVLRFWADYYAFYYGDGMKRTSDDWRYDVIYNMFSEGADIGSQGNAGFNNQRTGSGWGYRGRFPGGTPGNRYYFSSIIIKTFYAGGYRSIELVHPTITNVRHDNLNYSDGSNGSELSITVSYEGIIYHNDVTSVMENNPHYDPGVTNQNMETATNYGFGLDYFDNSRTGDEKFPDAFMSGDPITDLLKNRGIVDNLLEGIGTSIGLSPTTSDIISNAILRVSRRAAKGEPVNGSVLKSEAITFGSVLVGTTLNQSIEGPLYDLQSSVNARPSYQQQYQGVTQQMNSFGSATTAISSNAITGTPEALENGLSQDLLTQSASVLKSIQGNVNPDALNRSNKTRSVSDDFSATFGAASTVAVSQGVVRTVYTSHTEITTDPLDDDAMVNILPDETYVLTKKGAAVMNSMRSKTSAIGTKLPESHNSSSIQSALDAELG